MGFVLLKKMKLIVRICKRYLTKMTEHLTTVVFYVFNCMFSFAFKNVSKDDLHDKCSSIYRVADLAIRRREHILNIALSSPLSCNIMGLLLRGVVAEINLFVFKVDPMIIKDELQILRINEMAQGIFHPTTFESIQICEKMKFMSTKCEKTIALLALYQLACGDIGEAWDIALKGNSMEVQNVLSCIDINVANIISNLV